MSMPVVTAELIRSMGAQMQDKEYIKQVEAMMVDENPDLACLCSMNMDMLKNHISDPNSLRAAQIVGRVVYLITYNTLKQQMISDELSE